MILHCNFKRFWYVMEFQKKF